MSQPNAPNVKSLPIPTSAPQPLPDSLPQVAAFEPELLPAVLAASALEISKSKQAPIDFVAVTYMVALSSLIARHVAIRPMEHNEWTVVPNLWGLIVGRPSAKKSPSMSAALRPLDTLEEDATEQYEAARQAYQVENEFHAHQSKINQGEVQKLLKKKTAQGKSEATALIENHRDSEPVEPTCTRYVINDTTAEKLADVLQGNESLLIVRDELAGFFAGLERHGQESARAFYLEAWSGDRPFKVDRISRGSIRIPRACVSVLGGIQPGPITNLMREAQRQSRANDGLMQRFQLAVWPDLSSSFELVDLPHDRRAWAETVRLFERFSSIEPAGIGACSPDEGTPYLRFSPDAQSIFKAWLVEHENRLRSEDMPECMESHLGKYQSLVPSIALILHIAEGEAVDVGAVSLGKAIAWARYLESHARRIYAPIMGADFVAARALASKIMARKLGDRFSLKNVYRPGWANLSSRDYARQAVEILVDHNWIDKQTEKTGGRDATVYVVNPLIWEAEK